MLARTLPQTLAALRSGTISRRHADIIVDNAPALSGREDADVMLTDDEQQVIPFAENDTAARTRVHAQGVTATICPESIAERHRRARSERRVTVRSLGDGAAELYAILSELLAYAIHDRLTASAKDVVKSRPTGQRRPRRSALAKIRTERDAALARQSPSQPEPPTALEEEFEAQFRERPPWEGPEEDDTPLDPQAEEMAAQAAVPEDSIVAEDLLDEELAADAFHDSTPMHDGYGELEHDTRSLDQLRADIFADLLLTADPTATTGTALESIRATVQVTISASTLAGHDDAMAEFDGHGVMTPDAVRLLAGRAGSGDRIFARDQHCRFPGCRAPAHRCQMDHNHDHAKGGPTALCNLSLFCTRHHPLKHPDVDARYRWTATQLDGGGILWTSPLGRTYTDEAPLRVSPSPSRPLRRVQPSQIPVDVQRWALSVKP